MINFILNDQHISTHQPPGMVVLDFLRHHQRLIGTKAGCREGDCGSCLILLGNWNGKTMHYKAVNSCILPLGDVAGMHVVTIEGLNQDRLNPIQQALVDKGATQCGYCTPGFVMALTGFLLNAKQPDHAEAIDAISGNICRCTGYISIKRAANLVCQKFTIPIDIKDRIRLLVEWGILPEYFLHISEKLKTLPIQDRISSSSSVIVAGGTDLFVQQPEKLLSEDLTFLSRTIEDKGIWLDQHHCHISAVTTVETLKDSPIIQKFFPKIKDYIRLIASTPIRNRATLAGNIVNASPIGDLIIFLLALGATLTLNDGQKRRTLPLKEFFKGYKKLNKKENELVEWISFPKPEKDTLFNFEKVSKRTHLDIASVNTGIQIQIKGKKMGKIHLSAGGVGPVPLYLSRTANYLTGKEITCDHIRQAASIAQTEISPISDIRGSANYKHLLLRQLIFAHFITLFPQEINERELI